MTVIAIPKILQERLTDEGARMFVEILDKVENRTQTTVLTIAEERFEKRIAHLDTKIELVNTQLDAKIESVKTSLNARIDGVQTSLNSKIDVVKAEIGTGIESSKAELVKWMFLFWVGQVSVMAAIFFVFLKK